MEATQGHLLLSTFCVLQFNKQCALRAQINLWLMVVNLCVPGDLSCGCRKLSLEQISDEAVYGAEPRRVGSQMHLMSVQRTLSMAAGSSRTSC